MGILTHTKLDGRRDERPQMNHLKYRTGMQETKLIGFPSEQPLRVNNVTDWLLCRAERVGLQEAAELPRPGITPESSVLR